MQITHEEALRMIQFNADRALNIEKAALLDQHLRTCVECRTYAKQLSRMESALLDLMHKQWNLRPTPLAIDALTEKKNSRKIQSTLLVTRSAMIGIAFLTFIFIGWQFAMTNNPLNGSLPVLPVIPTPSTFYTATSYTLQDCIKVPYHVQESDTLQSIADHFSISKETLQEMNKLNTETIQPNAILLIPFCKSTATSTIHPPTFTITPFLEPIARTPG